MDSVKYGKLLNAVSMNGIFSLAMKEGKSIVVQTKIPDGLLAQAQDLVAAGWFRDLNEVMVTALRRFLESYRGELMEEFIRQDVEWGLRGDE